MKNFITIFLIALFIGISSLLAQETDYEKVYREIDEFVYSGDFEGGIDYLKKKISFYDTLEFYPDSNYSFYQQELGKIYYYIGEFKLAEDAYIKSIAYDRELLGEQNMDYISGLTVLAELYRQMGLYEKSLTLTNEIADLYERITIIDSLTYAYFLNNRGALYLSLGNLSKAEESLIASKELNDIILPQDHPEKAPILNNLGHLYKEQGRYAKTEDCYFKVVDIDKAYYGNDHIVIAQDYNNLGVFYSTIGNMDQGEKYLNMAMHIYQKKNEKKLGYVYTLNSLALIYLLRSEFVKAEQLCKEALSISDSLVSRNHDAYISLLGRLANIYQYQNQHRKAVSTLQESIEILQNTNPDHLSLIHQLYNVGMAYSDLGEYDTAEMKLKEAIRIASLNYTKDHKNYVKSLNALADILYRKDKSAEAREMFLESMELFTRNIHKNFDFLSAHEKLEFLSVLKENVYRFNAFAVDYYKQDPTIAGDLFVYNAFLKGLVLSSTRKIRQFGINASSGNEINQTYYDWLNTKEYLANLHTLTKSELEKRGINIDSVEQAAVLLEKRITRESAIFAGQMDSQGPSWKEVKQNLGKHEAFVQIIRYPEADSVVYVALMIKNNSNHPQIIILNRGNTYENEDYNDYISCIDSGYKVAKTYNDTTAYNKYWGKIENQAQGERTIYLLPDGVYNKINVSALMIPGGRFVYENHNVVLLTSAKDFIAQKGNIKLGNEVAVIIGDPDFSDVPEDEIRLASNEYMNSKTYLKFSNLRSDRLEPLPMAAKEIMYVDSLLSALKWHTRLFTRLNATENVVKSLRNPTILHISTHGFFTSPINSKQNILTENDFSTEVDPLFCSGLYLAGAQNSLKGEVMADKYAEDGILTAYEVTNLNLDSTQLVVLSACETGLGDIINGEGVFGLQRAFKIAGAENILMSLWKVDDRATQLFMKKFYTFWLSGHTKHEALRQTIDYFRFETKDYSHPFYWGGFVLLGKDQMKASGTDGLIFVIPIIVLLMVVFLILRKRII